MYELYRTEVRQSLS